MGQAVRGVVIPMYGEAPRLDAHGALVEGAWTALCEAVARWQGAGLEILVVLNPMSGPGYHPDGTALSEGTTVAYQAAMCHVQAAGARALGYVATGWLGAAPLATDWAYDGTAQYQVSRTVSTRAAALKAVEFSVDAWMKHYARLDGIFFDEVSVKGKRAIVSGYRQVAERARAARPHAWLVWNYGVPGPDLAPSPDPRWINGHFEGNAAHLADIEPLPGDGRSLVLAHHAVRPAWALARAEELGAAWFWALDQGDWAVAPRQSWFDDMLRTVASRGPPRS